MINEVDCEYDKLATHDEFRRCAFVIGANFHRKRIFILVC
jgi:hypothetical protein